MKFKLANFLVSEVQVSQVSKNQELVKFKLAIKKKKRKLAELQLGKKCLTLELS